MNECSMYLPTMNPDKFLEAPGSPYDLPVSSAAKPRYFTWMIPTSFITVDPELSFCWLNLGKKPVEVDWVLKYRYLNTGGCLGYFDDGGMPVITFDGGPSDVHITTLKATGVVSVLILGTQERLRRRLSRSLVTLTKQGRWERTSHWNTGA